MTTNEQRLAQLKAGRRELQHSLVAMTHLEIKAAARVKEHAEFIAAHETAIAKQEAAIAKQVERTSVLDDRVDKLVLAIGELISRIPPAALNP